MSAKLYNFKITVYKGVPIAGNIRVVGFFPPVTIPATLDESISENLEHPRVIQNSDITENRKVERTKESKMWMKRNLKRQPTRTNETNIFKRPRSKTRIHSTK